MTELGDIKNVTIGACSVTLGGTPIGHTLGGSVLTIERKFVELKVQAYGDMPVDIVTTGNELTLETTMAESTVQNLYSVMPEQLKIEGALGAIMGVGQDGGAAV